MRWIGTFTKIWAYAGISAVCAAVLFLFGYVFFQGAGIISVEFLTEAPKGLVLGEEGGIWPAITGSLSFTGTAWFSLLFRRQPQPSIWCFIAGARGSTRPYAW